MAAGLPSVADVSVPPVYGSEVLRLSHTEDTSADPLYHVNVKVGIRRASWCDGFGDFGRVTFPSFWSVTKPLGWGSRFLLLLIAYGHDHVVVVTLAFKFVQYWTLIRGAIDAEERVKSMYEV